MAVENCDFCKTETEKRCVKPLAQGEPRARIIISESGPQDLIMEPIECCRKRSEIFEKVAELI